MKSYRKSHYNVGDLVKLKNDYGFVLFKGQIVTVMDPNKYGPTYSIMVEDAQHKIYFVPSDFLKDVSSGHTSKRYNK